MKALALAALASIYIVFLIPSVALASDNESGIISNPNSAIDVASRNGSNAQEYPSNEQVGLAFTCGDCQNKCKGFWKGLSYLGPCDSLPNGAICLTYSDGYRWVVSDYRIDCAPIFAGVSNCRPIEVIRCYGAYYYHVLGTSFIMSVPRPESICMRSLPNTCMPA